MSALGVSLIGAFAGALFGGLVSWAVGRRQRRVQLALELHREFNSPEMVAIRHRASEPIDAHEYADFRQMRDELGRSNMLDVWAVQYFYQRLSLLVAHHQVDKRLIPELFGDILTWWTRGYFARMLFPLRTEPAQHVEALWLWMQRVASADQLTRWSHHIDSVEQGSDGI